ncbi:MAG: DUF1295 domain-containing protein [Haliscomenobacteraceae bacterium CHB4]|nr:hypothetical protein [Saprospiraceae bacterium]MCE7924554.1 DUF1295 domain-containing protein [Haliscomenobacteraceae bacterium CHB4]
MLRTIILLLSALVALPVVFFYFDEPLREEQWNVLQKALVIMSVIALACFVVSEITRNCSQVDKLWSIAPVIYVWLFAAGSGFDQRLTLMAGLVTLWGVRLTFNFWRRGGYHWIPWKGEEDYRWSVLRKMPLLQGRLRWAAFNLFFISFYQNALILLFTLPSVVAWQGTEQPLRVADWAVSGLFAFFLVIEAIADQQQFDFQKEKYRRLRMGEPLEGDYALGFRTTGLWGWVRHPNYAAEQAIWLTFYLFSVSATGRWLNWSLAGAILLMLLFLGSSDFSEKISAGKYPAYRDYRRKVPRFFPDLFRRS